jgi:hypothetical protein
MSARKTRLWTTRTRVDQLQGFHSNSLWHLLEVSGGKWSRLQCFCGLISR